MYSQEGQQEHSSSLVDMSAQAVECLVPVWVRRGRVEGKTGMLTITLWWILTGGGGLWKSLCSFPVCRSMMNWFSFPGTLVHEDDKTITAAQVKDLASYWRSSNHGKRYTCLRLSMAIIGRFCMCRKNKRGGENVKDTVYGTQQWTDILVFAKVCNGSANMAVIAFTAPL